MKELQRLIDDILTHLLGLYLLGLCAFEILASLFRGRTPEDRLTAD